MAATGASYFVMRLAFGDMTFAEMASSVELFATEVAPPLRKASLVTPALAAQRRA